MHQNVRKVSRRPGYNSLLTEWAQASRQRCRSTSGLFPVGFRDLTHQLSRRQCSYSCDTFLSRIGGLAHHDAKIRFELCITANLDARLLQRVKSAVSTTRQECPLCQRLCCKSRSLQGHEFFAKTRNGKQSPIRIDAIALSKSPVSLTLGDEVPHIFTRKPRQQPLEFLIIGAKRVLQRNFSDSDEIAALRQPSLRANSRSRRLIPTAACISAAAVHSADRGLAKVTSAAAYCASTAKERNVAYLSTILRNAM
jgi:hypothetical protein